MLFDAYVFVDWSSRTGRGPELPRKDSIWIGSARPGRRPEARYCRTREEAGGRVRTFLLEALRRGERVLAGFDFPYGYPRGLAATAGWGKPAWRATWDGLAARIVDGEDNRSNRFVAAAGLNRLLGGGPGPFWGRPISRKNPKGAPAWAALEPTSPGWPFTPRGRRPLGRLRAVDRRLAGTQDCWKLLGVGSVGSQALTGIPRVRALRLDPQLAKASAVWPFETGFTARLPARTRIVHAEIWPGIVNDLVLTRSEAIRDEAQVLAMCGWARALDRSGQLAALLGRPAGLGGEELEAVLEEEGWVLGCR